MPQFQFKARDDQGKLVSGVQEAENTTALANALLSSQMTPIEISLKENTGSKDIKLKIFEEKITEFDIMMFSRQVNTMLKAGIPIMRTLSGIQSTTKNKKMAEVVDDLRESLDGGRELSVALAEHPKLFNTFYVSMVRVGETTGNLEDVFLRLYEHMEFERFMQGQIKSALRYPMFVIIAMSAALVVINVMVIPQFEQVFASLGSDLPLLTKVLIGFSSFMRNYWYVLLLGIAGAWFGFKRYTSTQSGRLAWDQFKMKLPVAGNIVFKGTMARFARSFALSTRSGLPILGALKMIAQTVDNEFISSKVTGMSRGIERGETILRTATQSGVFNPLVLQMIAVGEDAGSLDDLMQEIADMYQADVEYDVKSLGAAIEPIMVVFLGALVLVLALGIFVPMWEMNSKMLHKG